MEVALDRRVCGWVWAHPPSHLKPLRQVQPALSRWLHSSAPTRRGGGEAATTGAGGCNTVLGGGGGSGGGGGVGLRVLTGGVVNSSQHRLVTTINPIKLPRSMARFRSKKPWRPLRDPWSYAEYGGSSATPHHHLFELLSTGALCTAPCSSRRPRTSPGMACASCPRGTWVRIRH